MAFRSTKMTNYSAHTPKIVRRKSRINNMAALPFVVPALIIYLIFIIYPIVLAFVLSFFHWDGVQPQRDYVGLENYIYLFTQDETFGRALLNSAIWVVFSLFIPTTLGLLLALGLNRALVGKLAFRAVFYLPATIASIGVATIWSWMYNPNFGVINSLLKQIGLGGLIQDWLGDRKVAIFSIFAASVWSSTGPGMLLFLAGLQGIARDLIEAAKVDGANRWQGFWNVVVPGLRETFIIVIALTIINSLKAFDLIYAMTNGGPGQSSNVLASWSYFTTFNARNYGRGTAIAMVLLVITLVIIVPYFRWVNRGED